MPRAERERSLCPGAQLVTFEAFRDLVKPLPIVSSLCAPRCSW